MLTGLAGVRNLQHSGTSSYIKPVTGCMKDQVRASRARGRRREHAENQDEQENLLRLFSWSFPFSLRSNFVCEL